MVLELSKTFEQPACNPEKKKRHTEEQLQGIVMDLMEKCGIEKEKVNIKDGQVLEINDLPNINLHTVMLEAEKLDLDFKYTKKTYIELC